MRVRFRIRATRNGMRTTESVETIVITETPSVGELRIMDPTGDSKLIWNVDNATETEAARAMFDSLKAKGYLAYRVEGEKHAKGEVMKSFDPQAGRIIMAPRMVGG